MYLGYDSQSSYTHTERSLSKARLVAQFWGTTVLSVRFSENKKIADISIIKKIEV